jgi:penicillin-binding protein 1B
MARGRRSSGGRRGQRQRGFVVLGTILAVVALAALVALLVLDHRVTAQFEGRRWTLPARVYAQPIDLYVGQPLGAARLVEELERLGYLASAAVDRPGTFRRKGDDLRLYVRGFRFADQPQEPRSLRIAFDGGMISAIRDAAGEEVPVFRLDPLLIGSIFPTHGEDRIVVAPEEVPALLPEALKAVEDRKFDEHHGVNPLAILRAAFVNVRAGQIEQGGSTLTQQLVKSYFLDSRRTLRRKAEEAVMAVILEARFEKADIMNAYINEIYLGQDGRRAVHGFGLASQFYFGKPLAELDLPEIALLVAVVRGPSYYDPRRHPERALERRNLVLRVLTEQGVVSAGDAERAAKAPLGLAEPGRRGGGYYPAFLDLVRRQLREDYEEADLTETGLTVFSTLDPLLQQAAEDALSGELDRLDRSGRKEAKGLEGVVVVTAPQTGEVVALVGGRRSGYDGFNRALDARRPIGSLAKPVVYLAALETGRYTPASLVDDAKVDLKLPNGDRWKPENFDRQVRGRVTLVRALAQSLNLATVNLGLDVGLGRVAGAFEQLGLAEPPPELPSMLLGATNLSPFEVARVYNTIANGGFRAPLRAVRAVIGEDGKPLKAPQLEVAETVSPEAVHALDRMMIEVMERGTGRAAKQQLPQGLVVAGKTGTSNDYRDSWFAGFSGSHLIVTWVGHDDNRPTGLTGTTGGLAVWTKLMGSIPTSSFEPLLPDTVDARWIDFYSGRETSPYCNGSAVSMPFLPGTALSPSENCPPDSTAPAEEGFDFGIGEEGLVEEPPPGEPEAAPEGASPTAPEIP